MNDENVTSAVGPRDLGMPVLRPRPTQADRPERPRAALLNNVPLFRAAVWASWHSTIWQWGEQPVGLLPTPDLFTSRDTPMHRLAPEECAGLRFFATEIEDAVALPGVVYEAKFRFALWRHQGKLDGMSGYDVAQELSVIYFDRATDPWPGFELIRYLDEIQFVPAYVPDGRRLRDRLDTT